MDDRWKEWIDTNLKRGCKKEDMFHMMIASGILPSVAKQALSISDAITIYPYDELPSKNLSLCTVLGNDSTKLYVMDNVLSKTQCKTLRRLSVGKLRPSTTTTNVKNFRTSSTHDFDSSDPMYAKVDNILSKFINIPLNYGEVTQVLLHSSEVC